MGHDDKRHYGEGHDHEDEEPSDLSYSDEKNSIEKIDQAGINGVTGHPEVVGMTLCVLNVSPRTNIEDHNADY